MAGINFYSGKKEEEPRSGEAIRIETPETYVVPKEVEPWVEKIEAAEMTLPKAVEQAGVQVVPDPSSSSPTAVSLNLPLTDDQIKKALHHKIADAIFWLAWWCLRQISLATGKNRPEKV